MNRDNYPKKKVPRFLELFEKLYMAAAMISIFFMMLSISADALSRYLFGSPITGQYEFTQFYLLVILVFMALPRTYVIGGHIRLNLLDGYRRKIPSLCLKGVMQRWLGLPLVQLPMSQVLRPSTSLSTWTSFSVPFNFPYTGVMSGCHLAAVLWRYA